jgi:hypothetical protein
MASGENPTRSLTLWLELICHDHGVNFHGGEQGCACGAMGSGKSTLCLKIAQEACYCPECNKKDLIEYALDTEKTRAKNVYVKPETVIYRAREYDHWTALLPENWRRSFPDRVARPKPLDVYVHVDDDFTFGYKDGNRVHAIPHLPPVRRYRNAYDLIQQMEEGHINVVYEPTNYTLNEFMYQVLEKKRMSKMERKKDTPIKSSVFWYELIHTLLKDKPHEYYTLAIDEFHDIAEMNPQQDMWHLQDVLAKAFLSLRKQNISLIASTHDHELIDYRITHRFGFWIWLIGSMPRASVSQVWPTSIPKLRIGKGWIEKKQSEFWKLEYGKIKHQPPIVHCLDVKDEKVKLEEYHEKPTDFDIIRVEELRGRLEV